MKNQKGVALLVVMGTITLLTALLATFTFDRKVDNRRAYNLQDRLQAKLNAEAGISLAMTRLKLYQDALNLFSKNKSTLQGIGASEQMLQFIWSMPFIYPIPLDKKNMDGIQRKALADFEKEMILQGGFSVTIANNSQLINLNRLRLSTKILSDDSITDVVNPNAKNTPESSKSMIEGFREKLVKLVEQQLEEKKQNDEDFDLKYPNDTAEFIIKCIQYYVSDGESIDFPEKGEIEKRFDGVQAKFAPLSSLSELYAIACLKDSVVDLLKNYVTVYANDTIDLNKINDRTLKMMFPNIREDQIKELLTYRDNPESPHPFDSMDTFKAYVVDQANIISTEEFDKMREEFEKAGITFGGQSLLFKITSVGKMNSTNYTLTAFVAIPTKEQKRDILVPISSDKTCPDSTLYVPYAENKNFCVLKKYLNREIPSEALEKANQKLAQTTQTSQDPDAPTTSPQQGASKTAPAEYLAPRIIELTTTAL